MKKFEGIMLWFFYIGLLVFSWFINTNPLYDYFVFILSGISTISAFIYLLIGIRKKLLIPRFFVFLAMLLVFLSFKFVVNNKIKNEVEVFFKSTFETMNACCSDKNMCLGLKKYGFIQVDSNYVANLDTKGANFSVSFHPDYVERKFEFRTGAYLSGAEIHSYSCK